MNAPRIDALARQLAGRTGSRRAALSLAGFSALAAALGRPGSPAAALRELAATPIAEETSTPTPTNTPKPKATATRTRTPTATATATSAPVAPATTAPACRIETTCDYDELANRSVCTSKGVAPAGAPKVTSVALDAAGVNADVIGGDALLTAPGDVLDAVGFTAVDGEAELMLVLNGKVTTQGQATYACGTDAGAVQATGPALVRVQEDVSTKTGVIVVRARRCDIASPAPANYDWHSQCSQPSVGALFTLSPASGAHVQDAGASRISGPDGRAAFGPVTPGAYQLSQAGQMWCHAESDSVDAQGRVTVRPESRATVWIFDCAAGRG